MHLRNQFLCFAAVSFLQFNLFSVASAHCNASCGAGKAARHVPFPFGFSASCRIQLNCSGDGGEIFIGDFPVRSISPDGDLLVGVAAKCHRPIQSLRPLFGRNFAPTSRNAVLLQNCSSRLSPCELPTAMVRSHFQMHDCEPAANSSSISCYSEKASDGGGGGFLNYSAVRESGCGSLYSAVFLESYNGSAVSMEVQLVRLEWWLDGACNCSEEADCHERVSPVTGNTGFRCRCRKGFEGDGFRAGRGCRKVSSTCNPSKYLLGQCSEATRLLLIGGITVGVSVIITAALLCCFVRHHTGLTLTARSNRKRLLSEAGAGNCSIPFYAYRDIERATCSFAEQQRLGTGAYGTVYMGRICNNELVAIKRIKHRDTDSIEQVLNEIKLLSSISHPNLVRLLGCSIEKGEQILIYEFMPNGTLWQHLQRERGSGLAWPIRLAVATETAQAIAHLHSADPPIYHRDIKSSNILLDYEFKSKVADFGLSRLGRTEESHISTAPQGTPGYLDPQYHQNYHLCDKSDVYSFGVVLVEIITALKVVDFSRPPNEVNLAALATERIRGGCLDDLIDPFLKQDTSTLSSVHKVAEVAFRCLAFHQDMRPSMVEVADELEQIRIRRLVSIAEDGINPNFPPLAPSNGSAKLPINRDEMGVLMESRGPLFAVQTGKGCGGSMEKEKDCSPVSVVQDPWLSEENSPSTSCLLTNAIQ